MTTGPWATGDEPVGDETVGDEHEHEHEHEHADEALTWGDERDASHVEGPDVVSAPVVATSDDADGTMSSAALVGHGVFGGVALLSTAGWIAAWSGFAYTFATLFGTIMWRLGLLLAVAAPFIWFLTVMALVPRHRTARRLLLMTGGALLLAPWPLLIGGGA
ncbi:hypothetical protein ACPEEZ_09995 [Frigoribacterium sp. 2-23]|uniref:hypothetical protein n=1 Tax=Frigoribacterium sp. 2-23 TaxID=3415006 RepID=UPI003C6FEAF8